MDEGIKLIYDANVCVAKPVEIREVYSINVFTSYVDMTKGSRVSASI